jgi:hypothetical protein
MKNLIKYLILIIPFFIFHQTAFSQPSNDNYTNPIVLDQVNNWCSDYGQYTNVNATADAFPGPSCWSSSPAHDVWFQFVAIATGVNIGIYGKGSSGGTLRYPRLALCSIESPSEFTYVGTACNEASYFQGFTSIFTSGLVIGNTYYIRVDGTQNYTGTFQLCVNNFTPSVQPGQDCNTAAFLCNKNTITQVALIGWDNNFIQVSNGCMSYMTSLSQPNNVAWYTFNIAKEGTLTISMNPNNNLDDLDFGLYQITNGDCSNLKVVRCSASRCYNDSGIIGPTGLDMSSIDTTESPGCGRLYQDDWTKYLNVKAGESYKLLINNCSNVQPGTDNGFTISFGGSCEFAGPEPDFDYTVNASCVEKSTITFTDKSIGASSYSWNFGKSAYPPTGDSAGPYTVSYSKTGSKVVVLTITGTGGCQVIKTAKIYMDSIAHFAFKDTSVCIGQSIRIYANGYSTYHWSDGSTGNPLIVSPKVSTAYYLTATTSNGCLAYGSVNVNIRSISVTSASNSPVCEGDTLRLFASTVNNGIYKWSGPYNFSDSKQNPEIKNISTLSSGTYTVVVTDNYHCSNTANVTVTVYPKPVISVIPNPAIICPGNPVNLKAYGGISYSWSPAVGLSSTTGKSVIANPDNNITYTVTGTDAKGCKNSIKVIVDKDKFQVNLGKDDTICPGTTKTLDAGKNMTYYTWNDNSQNEVLTVDKDGTYSVTVTDNNNCISSDTIMIYCYPSHKINLGNDTTIDIDATETLNAGSGYNKYMWQDGSSNSTYTVSGKGAYWVIVTDNNGCKFSDTIDIKVTCYSKGVFIPNFFTPGSSKICNSYFIIEGRCLGKAELKIFNRWGERIYWNDYDFTNNERDIKLCDDKSHTDITGNLKLYHYELWDGTDKRSGSHVAEGIYFFVLTYNISDDNLMNKITKKGSITVM